MIDSYVLETDSRFRCGGSVFGLSAGAIVSVVQLDEKTNKVLIKFSSRDIDWFDESILQRFNRIA